MRIPKLLLFSLLLLPVIAHAADETQHVDTATGCGGNDGTIGNPYCTCVEWEAQDRNLVSEDKNLTVLFTGSASTGQCTIDGWTTDATRKITLDGLAIDSDDYSSGALIINVANVTVQDFSLAKGGAFKVPDILRINAVANTTIQRGYLFSQSDLSNDGGGLGCIRHSGAAGTTTFRNLIIYDCLDHGISASFVSGETVNVENVTVVDAVDVGITIEPDSSSGSTINLYNNLAYSNGGGDYAITAGSATYNNGTNASGDTSSPNNTYDSQTPTFVNYAGKDFHLHATSDSEFQNVGTTRGGFSDDIDGDSRPQGAGWEIGADELIEASDGPLKASGFGVGFGFSNKGFGR